jgi:hypothetical protein
VLYDHIFYFLESLPVPLTSHPVELDSTMIQAEMAGAVEMERAYEVGSQPKRKTAENGHVS